MFDTTPPASLVVVLSGAVDQVDPGQDQSSTTSGARPQSTEPDLSAQCDGGIAVAVAVADISRSVSIESAQGTRTGSTASEPATTHRAGSGDDDDSVTVAERKARAKVRADGRLKAMAVLQRYHSSRSQTRLQSV